MTTDDRKPLTTVSFDRMMKDHWPRPGERIKQYVVDERARRAWIVATCPRFRRPLHDDNCGSECRESLEDALVYDMLKHDCCGDCNDTGELLLHDPDVIAWVEAYEQRRRSVPICADHDQLSDEIAPDPRLIGHPLFKLVGKR